MKVIMIKGSTKTIHDPYDASAVAIAIASHYLQFEPIKSIKESLAYAGKPFQTDDKLEFRSGRLVAKHKEIYLFAFEDSLFLKTGRNLTQWQEIMLIHVIKASTSGAMVNNFYSIISYLDEVSRDITKFKLVNASAKRSYEDYLKASITTMTPFFNAQRMLDSFKKKRIKSWEHQGKIICEFNSVKLGSKQEGFLIYNKIYIVLVGYRIDGFLFKFAEFDFSSYWNIPIILHPKLWMPITFISSNANFIDTDQYAMSLKKLVRSYSKEDPRCYKSIPEIIEDFQSRRKLWATNRFLVKDRTSLSKLIFTEGNR
jgi:hypothetical protein